MIVVSFIIISARPLTCPGRLDSVISPLRNEPAGIATFPSTMIGNMVSKYTGSPGLAVRVEIPLSSTRGICVPEGTTTATLAWGLAVADRVSGAAGRAGGEALAAAPGAGSVSPSCWDQAGDNPKARRTASQPMRAR